MKAVSSPLRLQVLNLLFDKGKLSYTELMASLKMNPSRDAGRFAYHLKSLLKADLVEADVETRKYFLTDLGNMVIDVADRIDKKAFKQKNALVRTSRLALEEFDANKIANSLVREARMPPELAQKVAKEAEKHLTQSKTKYLTAPLVREVVNALLIEKGLEEYRHKLTRVGVPVHDVSSLMEARKNIRTSVSVHELAGDIVFKEYTLLNVFPRDVADAHLSGSLYLSNLGTWILKPEEVMHDLRFFLQNGLNMEGIDPKQLVCKPPENLHSALSLVLNLLLHTSKEVDSWQVVDYFNVFLAPFFEDTDSPQLKGILRWFIETLNQHMNVALSIELTVPDHVADKPAIGPNGKKAGKYSDHVDRTQILASVLLDVFAEQTRLKPLTNVNLIVKMRAETAKNERAKALLLKSHALALDKGCVYFALASGKKREQSVFSCSGCRIDADVDGDWETDTMRTGCLGTVAVNLPRIVNDSGKDKARMFELLKERIELANRALEVKSNVLRRQGKTLLPFLTQKSNGDEYFRLEGCVRTISLTGIKEAALHLGDKSSLDAKGLELAKEIAEAAVTCTQRLGKRRGRRVMLTAVSPAEAAERLAQADMERYGVARTRFSGTRDRPYYAALVKARNIGEGFPSEALTLQGILNQTLAGGDLTVLELGEEINDADRLLSLTDIVVSHAGSGLLVYDRKLTYCSICRKTYRELQHKCPSCGAVGPLSFYDRFARA